MKDMQRELLNKLLDAYERSRIYTGEQRNNRRIQLAIDKTFPKYYDDAEYDYFCALNDAVATLEEKGLILAERHKNGTLKRVILLKDSIESAYFALNRRPRASVQQELRELLSAYAVQADVLGAYANAQMDRITKNRNVEYYDGDFQAYRDLLILVRALLDNENDCFIRDFSIRLFSESKRVETLRGRAEALLFAYGEYAEKSTIFEEHGVLRTPAYVNIRGAARIDLAGQMIDLSRLHGDIALSTQSLDDVERISLLSDCVITVENLTSFHEFDANTALVVYLGGFHNHTKRAFLKKIYAENPDAKYFHFGDIDAGGFYILDHLRRESGIPFQSFHMDLETLRKYRAFAKPLTGGDRVRLKRLLADTQEEARISVIGYMLEEGVKLEQEAVVCGYSSR